MPAIDRVRVQTYGFVCAAAAGSISPTPGNPVRAYLNIVNSGGGVLRVAFGKPAGVDNNDVFIAAGGSLLFDHKIPIDSINLFSTPGTTGTIIEGLPA